MVNVRFSNYEQFVKYFTNAPDKVRRILFKAYPEYAAKLASDYMNATKKITQATTKAKGKVNETVKAITQKPTNTSKPNPNLNDAFDTLYGKTKDVAGKAKGIKIPKVKVPNILKGAGRFVTALAPIQGAVNVLAKDSDLTDRLGGAGMIGTGTAALLGVPYTAPFAAAFMGGDFLKKTVSTPVGEKIGDWIYKPGNVVYNPDFTLLDTTQNLKGQQYTPEELEKIIAFNDAQHAKIAQQYGQAMTPYGATAEPTAVEQTGSIPSDYSQGVPQSSIPTNMGIIPQSFQNTQEGGLNNYQDILQGNQIQPTLNPIVEPVNYSNLYQQRANQVINELGGGQPQTGEQQMVDINPYSQIRGYDLTAQQAPISQGLDYQKILEQYNAAAEADRKQNAMNALANMSRYQVQKAPLYYVGATGDLRAIEQDQQSAPQLLPTNTSSNVDKLTGQLAIQQAQQEQAAAQYKQYQDLLKAQQERIDMENQANALAQRFGGDPAMYMNKDVINTLLKETINPNIQAEANIYETKGKAPTQAKLKQAEQLQEGANKLDEVALQGQFNTMIANINNQAMLIKTQFEQFGMNEREAAALATQWKIAQLSQYQQNYRALMEDTTKRDLAVYGRGTQKEVANIYANKDSKKNEYDIRVAQDKDWNTLIGTGTPIPEAIKYMQAKYPGWGSTEAELRELNR